MGAEFGVRGVDAEIDRSELSECCDSHPAIRELKMPVGRGGRGRRDGNSDTESISFGGNW